MKWTPVLFFAAGAFAFLAAFQAAFQADEPARPAAKAARTVVRVAPPDIRRGDTVAVRVVSGDVLLTFEAEAVSAAHIGESVIVLNPENGRRFVARVEDKGKVIVKK
jgi:ABC-type sulfate transport system substrate-binding protein